MRFYEAMRDELEDLTKEAGWPVGKRFFHLVTPSQSSKLRSAARGIAQRPSRALSIPKRVGRMAVRGIREGFRGPWHQKALQGVALADPVYTAYQMKKHPEEYKGQKGKRMGESVGLTLGTMAGSRLPFAGQILAGELGARAGRAVGRVAD